FDLDLGLLLFDAATPKLTIRQPSVQAETCLRLAAADVYASECGGKPWKRGRSNPRYSNQEGRCAHAQNLRGVILFVGGIRQVSRKCQREVQERQPADGAEPAESKSTGQRYAADWTDRRDDCLSRATRGREADLGQAGAVRKGMASRS